MTKIVKRTRKQALQHWINALESGKYTQAQETLRRTRRAGKDDRIKHSFCCIGVACDLARKDGGPQWADENGHTIRSVGGIRGYEDCEYFMGAQGYFPTEMREFLGITSDEEKKLVSMNDNDGATFKQIAKYIREEIMPQALKR